MCGCRKVPKWGEESLVLTSRIVVSDPTGRPPTRQTGPTFHKWRLSGSRITQRFGGAFGYDQVHHARSPANLCGAQTCSVSNLFVAEFVPLFVADRSRKIGGVRATE